MSPARRHHEIYLSDPRKTARRNSRPLSAIPLPSCKPYTPAIAGWVACTSGRQCDPRSGRQWPSQSP